MIKHWRRWDPRIEFKSPITEVRAFPQWIVEVEPDLFDPSNEALMQRVLTQLSQYDVRDRGRFVLRTAHVERALQVLRRLRERGTGYRSVRIPNDAIILAVYAETQEQLEAGTKALFVPRATPLDLVDVDPNEAIAMAMRDGVIFDFCMDKVEEVKAKGADALREYLRTRMSDMHFCKDIPVPTIAIYVSPRERMDLGAILQPMKSDHEAFMVKSKGSSYYYDEDDKAQIAPRQFDWIVCAGRIGPFSQSFRGQGPAPNNPHPMHHRWIVEALSAARAAGIPFCLPYLGEWAFTRGLSWNGVELVEDMSWGRSSRLDIDGVDWENVDYDASWKWGERGWGPETPNAKPGDSPVQAIGSHLTGRAIAGRVFDEWPTWWSTH
jgi:hypothetical protein